jgi:hypothetical protein
MSELYKYHKCIRGPINLWDQNGMNNQITIFIILEKINYFIYDDDAKLQY